MCACVCVCVCVYCYAAPLCLCLIHTCMYRLVRGGRGMLVTFRIHARDVAGNHLIEGGTKFTYFTGTKVQILTPEELQASIGLSGCIRRSRKGEEQGQEQVVA